MARRIESLMLAGPAGKLEALLEEPEEGEPRFAALVCHPHPQHGGTMHNKVVYRVARGLRKAGAVVLRFNYRGVNLSEGEYDNVVGELLDAEAALAVVRERYPDLPWWLAGFSFGSRIVLQLAAKQPGAGRVIAVGFPAQKTVWEPFLDCTAPTVFVQSPNDEFGPKDVFERYYAQVRGEKELIWIASSDHFFAGGLDELEAAAENLARK
ncbi:MAG: alpha/beta fold hydrolase [Acidimicrobiia bacterium]|nr:alpha/beta fold hydrolase [Acidimicrobiia bacterium]